MKVAYFDCFSGISGDMVLGALLDLGLDFNQLEKMLSKLSLTHYRIAAKSVKRGGIGGTKVSVSAYEKGLVRTWASIKRLIETAELPSQIKKKSLEIFSLLAKAEAKIHQKSIDQVHFHEVGAIDSVIDIAGSVIGISLLGIEKIYFSPLPLGIGMAKTNHGVIPIPSPATLEILKDVHTYSTGISAELVTPTGAAIAKSYASYFGPMPSMVVEDIGYGAGRAELEIPNLLRIIIGKLSAEPETDMVALIETNIDNTSGEAIGYLIDRLWALGALDVWWQAIGTKKDRPAITLRLLASLGKETKLVEEIFRQTGSIGVRVSQQKRWKAQRKIIQVKTNYGLISVKIASFQGKVVSLLPEYEDCARLAKQHHCQLTKIYQAAISAANQNIAKT